MTQAHHIVKRQVVELFVNSAEQSPALQERFRVLHQSSLKQKMNTLFDALCKKEEVIRLEKIEIDLGILQSGDLFESHFEQQMIEQLELALTEQINNETSLKPVPGEKQISAGGNKSSEKKFSATIQGSQESSLEQLCYFLITGELPWWSSTENWRLDQSLENLLEHQSLQIAQALRRSVTPVLIKRLVLQLSGNTRLKLLEVLQPGDKKKSRVLVDQWFRLITQLLLLDMLSIPLKFRVTLKKLQLMFNDKQLYSQLFWFDLFKLLLKQNSALTAENFIDKVIRQIVSKLKLEYTPVVEILSLVIKHSDVQQNELKAGLSQIMNQLSKEQNNYSVTGFNKLSLYTGEFSQSELVKKNISVTGNEAVADPFLTTSFLETENLLTNQQEIDELIRLQQQEAILKSEQSRYLSNAGIILLWPFITQFFNQLELIREKKFCSVQSRQKAILLLQYLGTGQQRFSEHQLLLNKILCGWPLLQPLSVQLEISQLEESAANELLHSLISHWSALKATSVAGLRTAFIQREGILKHQQSGWLLQIERTGYDVLIDKLPWGIGIVKLPWMNEPVHTDW